MKYIITLFVLNSILLFADAFKLSRDLTDLADKVSRETANEIDVNKIIDTSRIDYNKFKDLFKENEYEYKFKEENNKKFYASFINKNIELYINKYDSIENIKRNGIEKYIKELLLNDRSLLCSNRGAILGEIISTRVNHIGDVCNGNRRVNKFIRGNLFIVIVANNYNISEELFQLAKKIDHKICELNGIPYDPNFPEKEDNDSEEDKEVKRKIADGTYTKIEDLPKPQSESDNVKNNVKNNVKDPQEEKTVTKIELPISPKIENSKSRIFIIFGVLFTVVFGGFLLIYKKRKKKNKIKNNETNN